MRYHATCMDMTSNRKITFKGERSLDLVGTGHGKTCFPAAMRSVFNRAFQCYGVGEKDLYAE